MIRPARSAPAAHAPLIDALSLLALAAATALALGAALQPWVDPRLLFLDVIAAAQTSGFCCKVWYGFLSNLGVLAWCAAAAVSLFAALCLLGLRRDAAEARLLTYAGLLSAATAVDDMLLLHESVLPGFGVPQLLPLAFYAAAGLGYAWLRRGVLLSRDGAFLILAFAGFGASLAADLLVHSSDSWVVAGEDAAKFVGIVSWLVFHLRRALGAVAQPLAATG